MQHAPFLMGRGSCPFPGKSARTRSGRVLSPARRREAEKSWSKQALLQDEMAVAMTERAAVYFAEDHRQRSWKPLHQNGCEPMEITDPSDFGITTFEPPHSEQIAFPG